MERRQFTREFKLEAVRLIKDRGVSYGQASQDLGVHQSQLRDWVKKFGDQSVDRFSSSRARARSGYGFCASYRWAPNLAARRFWLSYSTAGREAALRENSFTEQIGPRFPRSRWPVPPPSLPRR